MDVHLASLVSKSFALKCLKKAWPSARIQVLKNPPPAIRKGYNLDENPDHEVWQIHAAGRGIEVCGPRDVLPYTAVREAFRIIAKMDAVFTAIKGGVNFTATPTPEPKKESAP